MRKSRASCWRNEGDPDARLRRLSSWASAWSRGEPVRSWARSAGSVDRLLVLVQALPHVYRDDGGVDVICDPETLLRAGGDCDPLSALFCAGARVLGVRCALVWAWQVGPSDHVTAMVWRDRRWQWADAMATGSVIGQNPWDFMAHDGGRP